MGLFTDTCVCGHSILNHETGGRCREITSATEAGLQVCTCPVYYDDGGGRRAAGAPGAPVTATPVLAHHMPGRERRLETAVELALDWWGLNTPAFVAKYGTGMTSKAMCDRLRAALTEGR